MKPLGARTRQALRWGLVVVVLGALVLSGRLRFDLIAGRLVTPAFVLMVAAQGALCLGNISRWVVIARGAGLSSSVRDLYRAGFRAHFATLLLPAVGGTDVVRVANLAREDLPRVGGTLLADRLWALMGVGVSLAIASWWAHSSPLRASLEPLLLPAVVLAAGIFATPLGLAVLRRILGWGTGPRRQAIVVVLDAALRGFSRPGTAAVALGLTLGGAFLNSLTLALGLPGPLGPAAFVVTPLLTLVTAVPITPQGLGIGEAAADWLFREVGVNGGAEAVALVRVAWGLATIPFGLAWRGTQPPEGLPPRTTSSR